MTSTQATEARGSADGDRRWYALFLLFLVYVFNFVDRSILGILAQPIKEELGVSDTAMGFLGGIAFALFYTALGLPLARLADRGNRRNIVAVCLALWSVMTAACGLAQSFIQLVIARVGVAVGEAGGSPPSHSMISDLFPPARRATALGIYSLGIPVGIMFGNFAGGWINEFFDWRTAFLAVGLPGVLLAIVVRLTLREPERGGSEGLAASASVEMPSIGFVFKTLWGRKSFRYMSLGAALHAFVGYGVGYWIPAFLIRSHEMPTGQIGTWLALIAGVGGGFGTFLGGYFADRLGARDQRWYVWLPGLATLVSVPFAAFSYLWTDARLALSVYFLPVFLGSFYLGPTFSMTQGLVGLRMRALASSILLFVLNLIGLGLGPQFVGILSDLFNANTGLGTESLRWSLVAVLVFNVISTLLYLVAGTTLREDLARSHELG